MSKILSIEVESSQIRVAEIDSSGKKRKMYHCFRIPAPQGSVEDGQIRDTKSLGDLLRQELNKRKIKTKKAFFVTGSTRIASREVRIPYVKKNKILSIINANATDYFPIDITKYVMSYSILGVEQISQEGENPDEKKKDKDSLKQYHLMVYAAPKAISAAYREFAQTAGLTMMGINCTGDTIYHGVKDRYREGTHILVKIELKNTSISIIKDGNLSLQRNINYGVDSAVEVVKSFPEFGDQIETEDALHILSGRDCVYPSLDGPLPQSADEEPDPVKSEITESFRYLIGNISRIMDYFISRNTNAVFDSIECCGLGAVIRGLTKLLSEELGQPVQPLDQLEGFSMPSGEQEEHFSIYLAVINPCKSGVNLMEKTTRKQREVKETLSGSIVVFVIGAVAGAVLTVAGIGNRIYQQQIQDHLNQRINEESSIEQIYNSYNAAKTRYDNYQNMYQYTNTPNEKLKAFIEEMEEKMPSDFTVDSFSSTGTQVSFSMRVASKSAAANTLIKLRTFESLATVTTTGMDEAEDGTISMSVACTYAEPATIDKSAE